MSKIKGVLYGLGIVAGLALGWLIMRTRDQKQDARIAAPLLTSSDKAAYIIDQPHHELEEVTRGPEDKEIIKKRFLAPHAKIEIRKDGSVVVSQRVWGTELSPFLGTSFDSEFKVRTSIGIGLFYLHSWELEGGLSLRPDDVRDVRAFLGAGYNIYSNLILTTAIDNHKVVSVGVALKF